MTILCDKCHHKLRELGGILLGQPDKAGKVQKWHLCIVCLEKIVRLLLGSTEGECDATTKY